MTDGSAASEVRFRFAVTTARAEVAAFAEALGFIAPGEPLEHVPLTYPVRWLAADAVRDWITGVLGGRGLPVHEMQDFAFRAPLAIDRAYALDVVCARAADPQRITVTAEVRDGRDLVCSARSSILVASLNPA